MVGVVTDGSPASAWGQSGADGRAWPVFLLAESRVRVISRLAQADFAGRGGQGGKVGGRVGVQGAVGGPEQACVAVAFGLGGDPPGQVAQVPAGVGVRLGLGRPAAGVPAGAVTVAQSRVPSASMAAGMSW